MVAPNGLPAEDISREDGVGLSLAALAGGPAVDCFPERPRTAHFRSRGGNLGLRLKPRSLPVLFPVNSYLPNRSLVTQRRIF